MSKNVVIFKAASDSGQDDTDIYSKKLSDAGFRVVNVPVLDFEFINVDLLTKALSFHTRFSGIIFTSPRAAKAVAQVLEQLNVTNHWIDHQHYVVGETTGKLVSSLGFKPIGRESGNAANLAEVILQCPNVEKPLLYPVGNLARDTLKSKLCSGSVNVEEIVVYQTKPHQLIEENLSKLNLQQPSNFYFIYFSPSGVKNTLPLMQKLGINLDRIKMIAIGPTTESAMHEAGLTVFGTASKPNPESLLQVLQA